LKTYTITASVNGGNGTITPSGDITVTHGENKTFEIVANPQYKIDKVLVNGVNEGAISSYTFSNITADGTIEAYFIDDVGIVVNDRELIYMFSHNNVVTIVNEALIPIKQAEIIDMFGRVIWAGQPTGNRTEITGEGISEGMEVLIGVDDAKKNAGAQAVASPLAGGNQMGGGGGMRR